jgi:hypothetical protein
VSDTAIEFGRRIPRITRLSLAASPRLIRWTLRAATLILFGAATAFGVSLGMSAPESSPASVVQHNATPPDM